MSGKHRDRQRSGRQPGQLSRQQTQPRTQQRQQRPQAAVERTVLGIPRRIAGLGALVVVAVLAVAGVAMIVNGGGAGSGTPSPSQWTVNGTNGSWTNVNSDRLAEMLPNKDFTLVNVKTPYFAEIDKTDLFIPYDQIASQAGKLPQDKSARILVYCRSGVESRQAAEALVALGYSNVWNLDGGMIAWQSSGHTLLYTHKP